MAPQDLAGRSLLAVFAHPDDESLACGGLLAGCTARGARVTILCATHGENDNGRRDEQLFQVRARELAEAAAVLGVGDVVLLEYRDGFLPWVEAAEFEARIVAEIDRTHPEVVVTFGQDGLYWHPDHCAVWERTTAAVASLGARAPALYYVTMPPGLIRRVADEYGADRRGTPTPVLGVVDHDAFGVSAAPPTVVLALGHLARRKLAALRCHRTQMRGLLAQVRDADAPRLLGVEHYHRAPVGFQGDTFLDHL